MAKDKVYQQVAAFLKENIKSGKLKIGEAIYSENLLCEKLGVSRTSVRKAIRMMVEDNILESHQGKGTFIKSDGNGIVHGKLCLLNHYTRVMQYDAIDSYYSDIIYGAEAQTREYDLDFSIFSKEFHTLPEAEKLFAKLKYDGAVIDGTFQTYPEQYNFLGNFFKNAVIVDGNPEEGDLPVAAPDAEKGFSQLITLAKQRGGKIFYTGHEVCSIDRWRKTCFERAAEKHGIEFVFINYGKNIRTDNFLHLGFHNVDHHPLIHEALKQFAVPRNAGGTFICASDYIAAKVMTSLHAMGYSVPGDFAVSGFGGILFSAYAVPAITTVKIVSGDLSRLAVNMLLAKIENKNLPSGLLDVDIIKRQSL